MNLARLVAAYEIERIRAAGEYLRKRARRGQPAWLNALKAPWHARLRKLSK
jgi:hypothetical protein